MTREIFGVKYESVTMIILFIYMGTAGILYFIAAFWGAPAQDVQHVINISVTSNSSLNKEANAAVTYECFKKCMDISYHDLGETYSRIAPFCQELCETYTGYS